MARTRSSGKQPQQQQSDQQHQPQLSQPGGFNIPTNAQQAVQLQADRQKLTEYRRDWQDSKGLGHTACRHLQDVLWWMSHVCGVNMLDYEEKVVVVCIFLAVLVLILLGAYKQGAQLVQLLKQLTLSGAK